MSLIISKYLEILILYPIILQILQQDHVISILSLLYRALPPTFVMTCY